MTTQPGSRSTNSSPSISVIIPAEGLAEGLEVCLSALQKQTLPPSEVIVVDNGFEGGGERLEQRAPYATVVTEERPGSYAARNAGLSVAKGSIVAFTDADCVPTPTWLEGALHFLQERPDVSIAAGYIEVTIRPEGPTAAEVLDARFGFPQESYVTELGFGATANLVVRRIAFQDAGLFRGDLRSGGDFEWCRRAGAAGHAIGFAPAAVVRHPARRTARAYLRKERRVMGGICSLARTGGTPKGMFARVLLAAALPPVVSGGAILGDPTLGPLAVRVRAMLLLANARVVRLATALRCLAGLLRAR